MRKAALLVLLGVISVLLADCIVTYPTFGPPEMRAEAIVGGPRPGYVWIGGHWGWSGGNYVWTRGHWAKAKRGRTWEPGRWEQRGRKWAWRDGRWR